MGFFNNKKDTSKKVPSMPAAPEVPTIGGSSSGGSDSVVAPPTMSKTNNFDDIKSQVTSKNENNNNAPAPEQKIDESEDSLFDLSDLNMPEEENKIPVQEEVKTPVQENVNMPEMPEEKNNNVEQSNNNYQPNEENKKEDISFAKNTDLDSIKKQDNIFVTTAQFKSLLNIVESVKTKVKKASETHLRLMDIKSEEDVEFENLRKSFQFIEDKLYEVDNLIFD